MRIMEHARQWVQAGHRVTVVTNVPNSPFGRFYVGYRNSFCQEEVIEGVSVRRMWTLASGKKFSKWHRVLSFMVYLVVSTLGGLKESKPDIVLASAPYLAGIPGMAASLWYGAPLIYEMRDPWVQVAANGGALTREGFVYKLLLHMERAFARYAQRVVVIGKEMARCIKDEMRLSEEPEVVYNGVSINMLEGKGGNAERLSLPEARGRFVIGCIGNMGNQYDFDVVVEAAVALTEAPCVFLFLGEGSQKKRIEEKAREKGLANIAFYSAVPPHEVGTWIRSCDVTVVSMRPEPIFRAYLPLKVLDSLALGVPVLFGGTGEAKQIVKACGGGETFPPGHKAALVKLIRDRMGDPEKLEAESRSGAEFIRLHYTRKVMALKYLKLMEKIVDGNRC